MKSPYMTKEFNFTVNVFAKNARSLAFMKWLKASKFAGDFDTSITEDKSGKSFVEIVQYNPYFTVDALEEVYLSMTDKRDKHSCEKCDGKQEEAPTKLVTTGFKNVKFQ